MRKATLIRIMLLAACFAGLEIACRSGAVSRTTIVPPSQMVVGLASFLDTGFILPDLMATLLAITVAVVSAIICGIALGAMIHAFPRVRRTLDPFLATYYSVPTLIFYPTLIVLFGLNDLPKIIIAFLHAVVIVITSTIAGLDRVPSVMIKTARIMRLSAVQTTISIVLPSAAPYIFNGVKLGIAYGVVGVIGAEFILASHGIGYQIAYAFNNFDNPKMYSLMLLVLILVYSINSAIMVWERRVMQRRGQA